MNENPQDSNKAEKGKVISIASGKGGTGKTVSALNLGMALHELGHHVLIIDADLEDPNIGINLGIYSPQVTFNEVLDKEKSLLEALYIHNTGLRVVPASLSIDYLRTNVQAMSEVITDIDGYVILDCGPGLNQKLLNSLKVSDSLIAITNPIRSSISGTIRLIETARDLQKNVEGVIVNNITSKEVSNEEIRHLTGCPILGEVPYDSNVDKSSVNKTPLVKYKPYSSASIAFKRIAHNLTGLEYNRTFMDKIKSSLHSFRSVFLE